jgi:hypothetical protein
LDVIYEENDYLRKVLGWLSGQEPQMKIMIEEFKRADGRGMGFEKKLGEKVGENSGESVYEKCVESNPEFEVIGDIQVPLPKPPKNSITPKPNHLCNKLDTTQGQALSKSKSKDKDKRRPSKSGYKKNKARAMVAGVSDVDSSSSDKQSSSSSEDEDAGRRKGKKSASRNLSGLSCVARLKVFVGWPIARAARRATRKTATPTWRMRQEAWRTFG